MEGVARSRHVPQIMIDCSYIHDDAVAYLQGIAQAQEVLHPEWFMSDFHLEVFARGYTSKETAAKAVLPLRQELESART